MAKADLRKAENGWRFLGEAIERAHALSRLSLKEFADFCEHDERQVKRWMTGDERPQIEVVFASERLRVHLVIALAEQAGVEVETTIRIRRTA